MDLAHSPRHTRRGFLRGDSAPKFFQIAIDAPGLVPQPDFRPPGSGGISHPLQYGLVPPPPDAAIDQLLTPADHLSFQPPVTDAANLLDGSSSNGVAFLSWLADQLAGQASEVTGLTHRLKVARPRPITEFGAHLMHGWTYEDSDPHVDFQFHEEENVLGDHQDAHGVDLSYELEAAYVQDEERLPEDITQAHAQAARDLLQPLIRMSPDGGRLEVFAAGSTVIKDVLGRVVEVQSQYGDCLYFRYGVLGNLEYFERRDSVGRTHSEGRRDKHGVVVRDREGRVRAAGESMTVDPRGCFYLHSLDGQFFCLDLVTGIHSERRRLIEDGGSVKFVTSLFTHDGFRMATMFSSIQHQADTIYGESPCLPNLRFYGRDGTLVEFASEEDLHHLNPVRATPPASRNVLRSWQRKRQANTAWDSVHEYLMRVS